MFDVVILTDHRYVNPTSTNWYIESYDFYTQGWVLSEFKKGLSFKINR